MLEEDLEIVIKQKVKPLVDDATQKFLGININELSDDISNKLQATSIEDIHVDTHLGFKEAKKRFKKAYLKKVLQLHLGNISEAAKIIGTDRRSIHRLIKEFHIDIKRIKKELVKPYDVNQGSVQNIIEQAITSYKTVIHPKRMSAFYENMATLSEDIMRELPIKEFTLKEAEQEFEKRFLAKALDENAGNVTQTAKKIGLRYETLHRKMKSLKL